MAYDVATSFNGYCITIPRIFIFSLTVKLLAIYGSGSLGIHGNRKQLSVSNSSAMAHGPHMSKHFNLRTLLNFFTEVLLG